MKKTDSVIVSAIIVTYNNKQWLSKSIPSLLRQEYPQIEVIVVDNASLDNACEYVEGNFGSVKLVKQKTNKGFGVGVNAGVRKAKGKYILVANEDMVFERNYVKRLVAVMEKDSSVGACQGVTYSYDRKSEVQSRGLLFNYSGVLMDDRKGEFNKGTDVSEIFAATVPFLVRKDVFNHLGGFDEDFFLYFEEVDLCWRMWLAGKRVVFTPGAEAFHKGGESTKKLPKGLLLEYSLRSRMQSYVKNLEITRLVIALIVQLLILTVGWFAFLFRGEFRQSLAICKAWSWNVWHLSSICDKRLRIQKSRVISDNKLLARVGSSLPISKLLFLSGVRRKS